MKFVKSWELSTEKANNMFHKTLLDIGLDGSQIFMLQSMYNVPSRHFHNVKHIAAMLLNYPILFNKYPDTTASISICFHDAIIGEHGEVNSGELMRCIVDRRIFNKQAKQIIGSTDYNQYGFGLLVKHEDDDGDGVLYMNELRQLDLIEHFHKEGYEITSQNIRSEAIEYFSLSPLEYNTKRKEFLKNILGKVLLEDIFEQQLIEQFDLTTEHLLAEYDKL